VPVLLEEVSYNPHAPPIVIGTVWDVLIMTQNNQLPGSMHQPSVGQFLFWKRLGWMFLFLAILAYLLLGLPAIPFHPDETTWIFMSADWDRITTLGPSAVAWNPDAEADPLQVERELAAPLTRDVIGMARELAGVPPLPIDWNWSATWDENQAAGAIPDPALLLLARIPQTVLLWGAILLAAYSAGQWGGGLASLAAALLMTFNSQLLLHARHAMSESILLFCILWAVLSADSLSRRGPRKWLWVISAGCAMAFAVSAKYSGLLTIPIVLMGVFFSIPFHPIGGGIRSFLGRIGVLLFTALVCFLILNSFYWSQPVSALQSVIRTRVAFQDRQLAAIRVAEPGWVLESAPARILGVVYEPFFAQPAFWDVPNYAEITKPSEEAYRVSYWSGFSLMAWFSTTWFALVFAGVVIGLRKLFYKTEYRPWAVLWIWMIVCIGGIVVGVPILWQRYYLILIPPFCIVAGIGLGAIADGFTSRLKKIIANNDSG
jgi:hypothetical protein